MRVTSSAAWFSRRLQSRTGRLLVALAVALSIAGFPAAAPAMATGAGWYDGVYAKSTITDCTSIVFPPQLSVDGAHVQVGYYANPDTGEPSPGQTYYIHVVVAGIGNACFGQWFVPEISLPPNTVLAVDGTHPIQCGNGNIGDTPLAVPNGECPQTVSPGVYGDFEFWSSYTNPSNPAADHLWPLPIGKFWDIRFPVQTSTSLSGARMDAYVHMTDGNSNPVVNAYQGVYVFSGTPAVYYPEPSTVDITRTYGKSLANVYTGGYSGSYTFQMGTTIAYAMVTDTGSLPAGHWQVWDDWQPLSGPSPLLPGTTYHWRMCVSLTSYGQICGADQTFTTAGAAATLGLVPAAATLQSGSTTTVTVTAKDGTNLAATGYRGTIHFTSSDPLAVLPADYTYVAGDNGVHAFTVKLRTPGAQTVSALDIANTTIIGTSSAVTVSDTVPPVVVAPTMNLRTGQPVTSASVPVTLTWPAATETGSGVARYELAKSADGGATWANLSTSITGTSYSTSVATSGKVLFRLRAVDKAGLAGAWAAGVNLSPRPTSETAATFTGTWASVLDASALGGSVKRTSLAGSAATYAFTGRSVGLLATVAAGRGSVAIYVDGAAAPAATVSTASATTGYARQIWQKTWTSTGTHTIKVVATGSSTVDLDGFVPVFNDTTAPTVTTAPVTTLRTGVSQSGTTVPITVAWTAADNAGGSGIGRYELSKSTDGGATWTNVSTSITSTSHPMTITASGSLRFRVRAVDRAGYASAWVSGTAISPSLVQTATGVGYAGTWSSATSVAYSGGSTKYASAAGATAMYSFTGRAVSFVTTKASTRGSAKIFIDGVLKTTISMTAATTAYQVPMYATSWGSSGAHTITVYVNGPGRVDVDAFVVLR